MPVRFCGRIAGTPLPNVHQKPVRLIDIAKRLGVAKITVSKALRDHPDLAPGTAARIKRAAAEMGYVPNYFARSLQARGGSGVLGVVVPKIRHAFFAEVLAAIQQAAAEQNYEILLAVSLENPEVERRHIDTFLSMRVDGLLLSVTETVGVRNPEVYARVARMGVPLVMFDRAPVDGDYAAVLMDDIHGAKQAVLSAVAQGRRRIAHLGSFRDVNIGHDRRIGYELGLAEAGLAVREDWIIEGGLSEADGYRGFEQLWSGKDRPDAIFCSSFPVAVGAMDAMRDLAPEDVGQILIIFFGVREMARFFPHPYICIAQPAEAMGRAAVSEVLQALKGVVKPPVRQVLPTDLMFSSNPSVPTARPKLAVGVHEPR
jgi:LacI family transcriptional regulator